MSTSRRRPLGAPVEHDGVIEQPVSHAHVPVARGLDVIGVGVHADPLTSSPHVPVALPKPSPAAYMSAAETAAVYVLSQSVPSSPTGIEAVCFKATTTVWSLGLPPSWASICA